MESLQYRTLSQDAEEAGKEIAACVRVQESLAWSPQIVPSHLFRAESIGLLYPEVDLGYLMLSLFQGRVVGYARVVHTSRRDIHWLHQLAVDPLFQGRGAGLGLLEAVGRRSLSLEANRVCFTFDPFESRNCRLYLTRAGARAVHLFRDLYGSMGSKAHGNRRSHRFLATLDLPPRPQGEVSRFSQARVVKGLPLPDEPILGMEIPYRMGDLSPKDACEWQDRALPLMEEALARGYQGVHLFTGPGEEKSFLIFEISEGGKGKNKTM